MIPKDTIIQCSNEECGKKLFRTLHNIPDRTPIYLDFIQDLGLEKDQLPEKDKPLACPFCGALFVIETSAAIQNNHLYEVHTEKGWHFN